MLVGRIATGDVEDTKRDAGAEASRKGGLKGGAARAAKLTSEERSKIAKLAAKGRWKSK